MKKVLQTDEAPAAIGPYSQGILTGNLLFVSGQLAINPATGALIDGTIAEQTRWIMENIRAILKEAGMSISHIVKTTIFLKNLEQFAEVNAAYGSFFEGAPPARSTVGVAALPLSADIEIEAIAILP